MLTCSWIFAAEFILEADSSGGAGSRGRSTCSLSESSDSKESSEPDIADSPENVLILVHASRLNNLVMSSSAQHSVALTCGEFRFKKFEKKKEVCQWGESRKTFTQYSKRENVKTCHLSCLRLLCGSIDGWGGESRNVHPIFYT